MVTKNIYITRTDMEKLREMILAARDFKKEEEKYLKELEAELNKAEVVEPQDIPANVITMNSEVYLSDLDTGEETNYRLVLPYQADASQGKISILAPIGTALLGYGVGDVIEWNVPAGAVKLKVEKIYQPEANGKAVS